MNIDWEYVAREVTARGIIVSPCPKCGGFDHYCGPEDGLTVFVGCKSCGATGPFVLVTDDRLSNFHELLRDFHVESMIEELQIEQMILAINLWNQDPWGKSSPPAFSVRTKRKTKPS